MSILVIAAYHCEVAGKPTDSVDYQVRQFASDSLDNITASLRVEPPQAFHKNCWDKQEDALAVRRHSERKLSSIPDLRTGRK